MIDCNIFKSNALIRFKVLNRMPVRRQLPVTDEIAERYLESVCGLRRPEPPTPEFEQLVYETRRELSVSKRLIDCPELSAITSALNGIRATALSRWCNRSGIDNGLYLVRLTSINRVAEYVSQAVAEVRNDLVPKLAAVYPAKVDGIRQVWGDKIASVLPPVDKLPELFGVETMLLQLTVPEGLPPEIREAEEKKLRDTFEAARGQIIQSLWVEFQGLVDHLIDCLTPDATGTGKAVRKNSSMINNIREFCEAFGDKNAFNDDRLAELVNKTAGILDAVGQGGDVATRLRDYSGVRENVKSAFETLKADIDAGVEAAASRTFSFDD